MPKLKTNKSAAKRFIKMGSGRVKRSCRNHNHNLGNKNSKHKARLCKLVSIHETDQERVAFLLPYDQR